MFFLYFKTNGEIILPIHRRDPCSRTLNKESNCELGSGIKWENVDLFYAPDEEFDDPDDFVRTAPFGKYYVEDNEIKENFDWEEPEEEEG